MPRIITAVFSDSNFGKAIGAWQWDYGSVLRIQGLHLDPAVEIHFSLTERGGDSEPRIGTTKDGVTDVVIPDSMLSYESTRDYDIFAFVYKRDEDSGQTEYKIRIRVKARPKPEAFEKPEEAELFRKAIEAVNESSVAAREAEKSSEAWAHGHPDYPEREEDNAAYYAGQARSAMEDARQAAANSGYIKMQVEEDGNLYVYRTDNLAESLDFAINENGELEVGME